MPGTDWARFYSQGKINFETKMHPICVAIFVGVFILAYLISKSAKWWSKKAEYDEYGLDEIPLG